MKLFRWLVDEVATVLAVTCYFALCFLTILFLKRLLLEQYDIQFSAMSTGLVLALVAAKVAVVLDRAPLRIGPGAVEVLIRTVLYTATTCVLLILEKAWELRGEAGGFTAAFAGMWDHPEMPRIGAVLVCVALAFAGYAAFMIVRREVGDETLRRMFLHRSDSSRS